MFCCHNEGCFKSYKTKHSLNNHILSKHPKNNQLMNIQPIILNDDVVVVDNLNERFEELIQYCEKYFLPNGDKTLCTQEIFNRGFHSFDYVFKLEAYLQSKNNAKVSIFKERKNIVIERISQLDTQEQAFINSRINVDLETLKNIKKYIDTELLFVNYLIDINNTNFKSIQTLLTSLNEITSQHGNHLHYSPVTNIDPSFEAQNRENFRNQIIRKDFKLKLYNSIVIFISIVVIVGISYWFKKDLKIIVLKSLNLIQNIINYIQ